MIVVVFGPGGVGKGALVDRLLATDPRLWLSRSWTTRGRRPGERADAYVFVTREEFLAAMERGTFLETNEFAGNGQLYGTPWPDPERDDVDVVLEIDLNGARQVKQRFPDALAVLVAPPSRQELERRLRARGDDDDHVRRRLDLSEYELAAGREIADRVVVNDDLAGAAAELGRILDARRAHQPGAGA